MQGLLEKLFSSPPYPSTFPSKIPYLRQPLQLYQSCEPNGDEEIRTPDILLAKQALYQLSYIPDKQDALWKSIPKSMTTVGSVAINPYSGRTWIRTKDLSFIRAAL